MLSVGFFFLFFFLNNFISEGRHKLLTRSTFFFPLTLFFFVSRMRFKRPLGDDRRQTSRPLSRRCIIALSWQRAAVTTIKWRHTRASAKVILICIMCPERSALALGMLMNARVSSERGVRHKTPSSYKSMSRWSSSSPASPNMHFLFSYSAICIYPPY